MPQRPQPVGPAMCAAPVARARRACASAQPHAQLDAGRRARRSRGRRSRRRGDDALGQAEADGEVLEVGGRRHHHGVGRAVVGEGDRRPPPGSRARPCSRPPPRTASAPDAGDGLGHRRYSAASAWAAMRRLCAESSSYSSCQSRRAVRRRHLHRRHLVFGAVGRPVGEVGGDDVGLRHRDGGRWCRRRPAPRAR